MKKLVIGLTGGIASGKSEFLKIAKKLGFETFSADESAHHCLKTSHPAYKKVVGHFGRHILNSRKEIIRSSLAEIIFRDVRERKFLERVIHPCVRADLKRKICEAQGPLIVDIPLLFEAHFEHLVDKILVVKASRRLQIDRLMRRNGLSRTEALRRICAQIPLADKVKKADFVIANSGTINDFHQRAADFLLDTAGMFCNNNFKTLPYKSKVNPEHIATR
jgi:dephospho-CoA kinase